ncbi:hypothetical protein AMTRI_Chr08g164530 [Amborella trichopoda]
MKNPTCSVCQLAYDKGEHTLMLLHCGHACRRDCLMRLFAASSDHSLRTRPRKRWWRWVEDGVLRKSR